MRIGKCLLELELPPRARRILIGEEAAPDDKGTTSACAENTHAQFHGNYTAGNYLRVRGEYSQPLLIASPMMELPPRARRIPCEFIGCVPQAGTTSACAENTW